MKQKKKRQRKREFNVIYERSKDIEFKIDKAKEGEKFLVVILDVKI